MYLTWIFNIGKWVCYRTWTSLFDWGGLVEGLLFSGGRYSFRSLTEVTIFSWYFQGEGGSFLSEVYSRCCNSFLRVHLLVTFVRHFLIYSFLRSFVSHAMKVARDTAQFQQEYKQEGKHLSICISKGEDIKIKMKVSPFVLPPLIYLPFIAFLSLFFFCLHGLEAA